ncbi:MAG: helix-turn-helix domain-containing protein [Clostridia bacterium]
MTLGEKIAKQRKENNYTQEQLADILGVSRQSVSKWESDIAYPETDKLIKLGKLFDCSMDYLLNEDCTDRSGKDTDEVVSVLIRYIPPSRDNAGKGKAKK